MICNFCKKAPTIKNSHVVPRFMSKHIKRNSPFGYMLNSWKKNLTYDLYKGPYFCQKCDNEIIGSWENYFFTNVWNNPLTAGMQWSQPKSINFILSLVYRYAIHFLETSPIHVNHLYSDCVKVTTESAIRDLSLIGQSVFIYPYVHQEISMECSLLPGVNHLLRLAAHGEGLPKEEDLPNAFLVIVPKMVFLICDADIALCQANEIKNPVHIIPGQSFDPRSSNVDMPIFLSSILNRLINHTQTLQKQLGYWRKLAYGLDKKLNPNKICYLAQSQDQKLKAWKRKNCP